LSVKYLIEIELLSIIGIELLSVRNLIGVELLSVRDLIGIAIH
jgi:hypothetical protein